MFPVVEAMIAPVIVNAEEVKKKSNIRIGYLHREYTQKNKSRLFRSLAGVQSFELHT